MSKGFITLSRSLFDHWLWEKRPFDKARAWVDLIRRAEYEDGFKEVQGKLIKVERGQVVVSERFLMKAWGWGNTKVRNFLKLLENDSMLTLKTKQGITVISLCNYDTYNNTAKQNKAETKQGQSRDKAGTKRNEQVKEVKEVNKTTSSSYAREGKSQIDDFAKEVLEDIIFIEQTALSQKIGRDEIPDFVAEFVQYKKALGEINHETYSDFRKNLYHWIKKRRENAVEKKPKPAGAKIIDPRDYDKYRQKN